MSFGYLVKDVWWTAQGWRPSNTRDPYLQVYKTFDVKMINLALATVRHSKERQEQSAVIKLRETLGWQWKSFPKQAQSMGKGKGRWRI